MERKISQATYYRRLKMWTKTLYDEDGVAYIVNPKHAMKKPVCKCCNKNKTEK